MKISTQKSNAPGRIKKRYIIVGIIALLLLFPIAINSILIQKEYAEYTVKAEAEFNKSNYEESLEWYEKAKSIKSLSESDENNYLKSKEIMKSQDCFEKGDSAFTEGNYDTAISNLKNVIEEDSNYDEAQKILVEAKNRYAEGLLNEAKSFYAKGDYKGAYGLLKLSSTTTTSQYEPAMALLPQYEEKYNNAIKAEEEETKKKALAQAREQMKFYEKGIGPVSIAAETKTSKTVSSSYTTWTAAKDCQFVWVCVYAKNEGSKTTHVNPNYITLSTPSGHTVNPDSGPTYSRQNNFDAIDLPPGGNSAGWLIFHVPIEDKYILNYNSIDSVVTKQIVP